MWLASCLKYSGQNDHFSHYAIHAVHNQDITIKISCDHRDLFAGICSEKNSGAKNSAHRKLFPKTVPLWVMELFSPLIH